MKLISLINLLTFSVFFLSCGQDNDTPNNNRHKPVIYSIDEFCMGVDLSYVNQILNHGGIYKDSGQIRDPYLIFKNHGANTVRVRLWHNPAWTMDVYGNSASHMYHDLNDVANTIRRAKEQGMAVNLDIHYSDTWADPGYQKPPAAWKNISNLTVLKDSVYLYTYHTLQYLNNKGLMPEMVQIGNEINCGMLITNTDSLFPNINGCKGHFKELGEVLNAAIRAVREISAHSSMKPQIILHIADPKNLDWWFGNITATGNVTDFDIIGFSYYTLWHKTVAFNDLPELVTNIKEKYNKKIMIAETAYPWTNEDADNYGNIYGIDGQLEAFPYTIDGQYNFLVTLTQNMINAGCSGIMYWEPGWITSKMKDLWGTGSSWDNNTLFDFEGNVIEGIDFMNFPYQFPEKNK